MRKIELRTIKLMDMLKARETLDVRDVVKSLGISEATTRRMFAGLEQEGKVIRTHGGIRLAPQLEYDYSYRISAVHQSEAKEVIGTYVSERINDHDRIFLDSGTTVLKLSEAISRRIQMGTLKDIVVLTNSLSYIETLASCTKVILLGGEIRPERRDVCGSLTEINLEKYHINKAYMGSDGITIKGGFMATDENTARMNELVMKSSGETCILADSTKFNKSSFVSYARLNEIDSIFTDAKIKKSVLKSYQQAGAIVKIVG